MNKEWPLANKSETRHGEDKLPYRVTRRVCRTGASPVSARLDLLEMKPTILSLSRHEETSGFVTITASSAKYMACRAPGYRHHRAESREGRRRGEEGALLSSATCAEHHTEISWTDCLYSTWNSKLPYCSVDLPMTHITVHENASIGSDSFGDADTGCEGLRSEIPKRLYSTTSAVILHSCISLVIKPSFPSSSGLWSEVGVYRCRG